MMSVFQVIALVFALCMLYVVTIHRRKSRLSQGETILWYLLWSAFVLISIFPQVLLTITQTLRFSRVFDLLVVMAFMVLSVLVFATYFAQREDRQKIEQVVRHHALHTLAPRQRRSTQSRKRST
jgi:hypothetical protein